MRCVPGAFATLCGVSWERSRELSSYLPAGVENARSCGSHPIPAWLARRLPRRTVALVSVTISAWFTSAGDHLLRTSPCFDALRLLEDLCARRSG